MNSQQFSEFLNNPGSTNARSLVLLEDVVTRYPYCQSGHLLYTYNLFREEDPQYPTQLKKAAAYAGDRRILKGLIGLEKKEALPVLPPQPVKSFVVTWELTPKLSEAEISNRLAASGTQVRMTQEELLAIVKKRLAEINAEKNPGQPPSPDISFPGLAGGSSALPGKQTSMIPTPAPNASKKALIDKFILEEPRISKPKSSFFNPTESAIRSNFDDEEIVSETLAQLYAKQGNIPKAIHIYEKLSLLNEEKSRYFAAQIKQLSS